MLAGEIGRGGHTSEVTHRTDEESNFLHEAASHES